jgi:hypothetical protein
MVQKLKSHGLTVVIIEETSKPFALFHDCCPGVDYLWWNDKTIL